MNDSVRFVEDTVFAKAAAPRITLADIEQQIVAERYINGAQLIFEASPCTREHVSPPPVEVEIVDYAVADSLGRLTICVLVLRNGYHVTGESSCIATESFDAAIGRKMAREAAIDKIWPLLGYELRTKLHAGGRGG